MVLMIWIVPIGLILTHMDAMIIFQFGSKCPEGSKITAELPAIIAMVSNMRHKYLSKLTLNFIDFFTHKISRSHNIEFLFRRL